MCAVDWKWSLLFACFCLILNDVVVDGGKAVATSEEDSRDEPVGSSGSNSHTPTASTQSKHDKYGSTMFHSSAPSYYGYSMSYPPPPYSYNSYNPYYPDTVNERSGKDFSTRSSNNIPVNSNFGYGPTSAEFGGQATAASHGHAQHSSGGHGHGHGWGWKGHGHGGGGLDTSALGLLGLIGLFSLLQNVLMSLTTTTTTTARTGRRRRDASGIQSDLDEEAVNDEGIKRTNEISLMVLPALNAVAHARNGGIPLECTRREICRVNHVLMRELGGQGRHVGSMMSSAIIKLLKEVDHKGEVEKQLTNAALIGRSGGKCDVIYPLCDSLQKRKKPLPLLMQPSHFIQFGIDHSAAQQATVQQKPNANVLV